MFLVKKHIHEANAWAGREGGMLSFIFENISSKDNTEL